jgi:hypothetical protein
MTKIEDALKKIPPTRKGSRCSVAALYAAVPEAERAALKKAVEDIGVNRTPALGLSLAISSAYGIDVHRASLDRHRRKDCLCGRIER